MTSLEPQIANKAVDKMVERAKSLHLHGCSMLALAKIINNRVPIMSVTSEVNLGQGADRAIERVFEKGTRRKIVANIRRETGLGGGSTKSGKKTRGVVVKKFSKDEFMATAFKGTLKRDLGLHNEIAWEGMEIYGYLNSVTSGMMVLPLVD